MNEEARKKQKEYMRAYREKNKKKLNAYRRKWNKENPDKVRTYQANYWNRLAEQEAEQGAKVVNEG